MTGADIRGADCGHLAETGRGLAGRGRGAPGATCLTRGPCWVGARLNRSDVRPGTGAGGDPVQAGLPLRLMFSVSRLTGGVPAPLVGAWVDIWHASGAGACSDVSGGAGN